MFLSFLYALDFNLPLQNKVLVFSIILFIILFAPLLLNKIKIPHLIGLIIAGAAIGANGFNLIERSEITLYSAVGLLYIMFLAGLEIDIADFKKNSGKSLVFGLLTFAIPMTLGMIAGLYLLNFNMTTSVLLASMFASHTLIAYPIVSKLGVTKNRAVNITVGGTMITDTLALLVLAVIVGMSKGDISKEFWFSLGIGLIIFGSIVMFVFPIIGRWFFKRFSDNISQYIFVLAMVFLGAFLAEAAGIEGIIGAFLSGLSLNRLIPHTSPLMNRIEFVGNALFIPIFLISVGMLIDFKVFFKDFETIKVAIIMTVVATLAKFLAAYSTQKIYGFSKDERRLIFGLSNAQAAATLAAVLVGFQLGIFEETVLNGTIVMILVTCTQASLAAQKGAKNIAMLEMSDEEGIDEDIDERILIPVNRLETTEELVNLSITVKSKNNKSGMYALNVINNSDEFGSSEKNGRKIIDLASIAASSVDVRIHELLRYDVNVVNGISNVVKEHKISDIIMGFNEKEFFNDSFFGNLTDGILSKCNTTTMVYKSNQPLATIKRHLVIVPDRAEREIGFPFWLIKVWNIARNTGAKLEFYSSESTINFIKEINANHPVQCAFHTFNEWSEFLILAKEIKSDDNVIVVLSRKDRPSYNSIMPKIPIYLVKHFNTSNFMLIYPMQMGVEEDYSVDFKNPSVIEPLGKLDDIGKTIARLFKRK